jgi:hypothetical protein
MHYYMTGDWRANGANNAQRRRDELELVDAVGGAICCQRGQVPVLAERQPHVTQGQ